MRHCSRGEPSLSHQTRYWILTTKAFHVKRGKDYYRCLNGNPGSSRLPARKSVSAVGSSKSTVHVRGITLGTVAVCISPLHLTPVTPGAQICSQPGFSHSLPLSRSIFCVLPPSTSGTLGTTLNLPRTTLSVERSKPPFCPRKSLLRRTLVLLVSTHWTSLGLAWMIIILPFPDTPRIGGAMALVELEPKNLTHVVHMEIRIIHVPNLLCRHGVVF